MELPERIATIIKVNQHTAASFADAIGVQRSSISHILNGRNKPSIDLLEKILLHFPRVDAAWLITGRAPRRDGPIAQASTEAPKAGESHGSPHVETAADGEARLPQAFLAKAGQQARKEGKTIETIIICYTDRTFVAYEPT